MNHGDFRLSDCQVKHGIALVADALHCKKKSAEIVVNAGANYLFVVKDNEPTLRADIELFIQNESVSSYSTIEKMEGA